MLTPLGFLIGDSQSELGKEFFDFKMHIEIIAGKRGKKIKINLSYRASQFSN